MPKSSLRNRFIKIGFRRFAWVALLWWRITMCFTREKRIGMRIYEYPEDITEALGFGRRYKKDKWNGRLDVLFHPTRIQKLIDASVDGDIADCEDHAIYLCATLSLIMKEVYLAVYCADDPDGKMFGHAVCVYREYGSDEYWVIDYTEPEMVTNLMDFPLVSRTMLGYNTSTPVAAWAVPIKTLSRHATPKFGKIRTRTDF